MTMSAQILVVEDEQIVAKDIQRTLQELGYTVPDPVDAAESALQAVDRLRPDLVLMDIRLRGGIDGITTAMMIRDRWDVPVVYLTAHADKATLDRAKVSEPFGYVLKPFEERDLHATVEMALYKHDLERKLRESQRWLSVTLNSIGDGVIATNPQGEIVFINPVAQQLTGYSSEEAVGRSLVDVFRIINEYSRQPVEDPVAKVIATGMAVGLANHTLLIAKDGSERPIDDSGAPIQAPGGALQGVVLVFRDVTERRKAEVDLRESERRFKTLASHAPVGIFQTDANGDCLFVNERWCEMAGLTQEQARGQGWAAALHPADRERVFKDWYEATRAGHEFAGEYRFQSSGGKVAWLSGSAVALKTKDGATAGYIGTVTDITPRKEAEEVLRALQNELRTVTDAMSARVTRCSRDFRYLWVSRHYAQWLGLTPEQIIGRSIDEILGEAAFQKLRPYYQRVLGGEGVEFSEELNLTRVGTRWINGVYTPTHDPEGQVDGWVAVVIDVTEQRRLENALKESDRRKDEFLAILAHELRNPLAPIKSSVTILKALQSTDRTLIELRDIIDRQVQHMARLLDDLLDVNRITSGKLELRKERCLLAEVVDSAVEASLPLMRAKGHSFTVTLPPDPIHLYADKVRLGQVFCNLLNNATKYSDKGGQIALTGQVAGQNVLVSVKDNGIGIAPETLSHIFEIFSQVSPALERSEGGLGVGLFLVKALLDLHGGGITVGSGGLGQGSEFIVRLPLAMDSAAPRRLADPHAGESLSQRKHRLLIVDDLKDSADSLSQLLRIMGHEVRTAYGGHQAIDIASDMRPDVILLDLGMPKLNGYDTCRRIREQPWGKDVLIVAVTGWGQDSDRRRTAQAGFDHHLVKPIDAAELLRWIAARTLTAENS